jgi:hypothetical protein
MSFCADEPHSPGVSGSFGLSPLQASLVKTSDKLARCREKSELARDAQHRRGSVPRSPLQSGGFPPRTLRVCGTGQAANGQQSHQNLGCHPCSCHVRPCRSWLPVGLARCGKYPRPFGLRVWASFASRWMLKMWDRWVNLGEWSAVWVVVHDVCGENSSTALPVMV